MSPHESKPPAGGTARPAGGESELSRIDLKTIVDALPLMLFVLDENDVYVDYRIGGHSVPFVPPERFLGRGLPDVLPDPPASELAHAVARARATGDEVTVEYSLPGPTGPEAFEARIVPLGVGKVAVLVVTVTERFEARELIAAKLRHQSAVANLGQMAIRSDDLQELLETAVHAVADTLGVEFSKVLESEGDGQSLLLRAGHGWRPGLVGEARVSAGQDSQAGHTLCSDDAVVVLDLRSEERFQGPPLLRDHGVVSGISVVIRSRDGAYGVLGAHTTQERRFTEDETLLLQAVANILGQAVERHRILGRLRENEERFRLLIDRSADLIGVFSQDGVIQFVGASAERVLGFRPEEMAGRSALDWVHPEDWEAASRTLAQVARSPGAVSQVTIRYRHRDGTYRVLESSGINLTHVPAVGGIVVNSRDVTERRSLEEQLNQSQRLESVGRLAGGIAHDVNNMLTAILANAELLASTQGSGSAGTEELDEIVHSSLRARDLVHQLLAFACRQVLAPQVLDLNRSVRDSERLLRRLLPEDVVLRLRLAEPLEPVMADPAQVEQVLMNLAVNARDAMPHGGGITIETADVDLDAEFALTHAGNVEPGPYVMVAVSDTGAGMAPEVLARAFEPFFTTKPQGLGTGLGLATTYGIVKQSGGYISAHSEVGVGTTFRIYFPRARGPVVETVEPAAAAARGGTETVLLVEDDESVGSVARRILERAGYHVLATSTPEAALTLEAGFRDTIHLLITDVVMPGMSGRQVADELRRRRPGLAVLYMSGYTESAIASHGLTGTWFLPKPFTGPGLVAKVRDVLDASAELAASAPGEAN